MQRDDALLVDIYTSVVSAISYLSGTTFLEFENDRKTQKAFICELLIIGEATKKLSPEFREHNNQIPWSSMARMRDKLVHDYDEVHPAILWSTGTKNLVLLLEQIEPLVPK